MSSKSFPIGMENATDFILRTYRFCQPYQWAREVLMNAIEAHAKKVEFGVEWQSVTKEGVYRHMICDDGDGMSAEQLKKYFTNIQSSGKAVMQEMNENDRVIHTNFGIGCRISLLPWNGAGVVYISYQNGIGSMIRMYYDIEEKAYSISSWEFNDEIATVIDPMSVEWEEDEIDWSLVAPKWVRDHGTCIILMGNDSKTDTYMQSEKGYTSNLTRYINTRFFNLDNIQVSVKEFNYGKANRDEWPRCEKEFNEKLQKYNTTRGNTRICHGAKYYITEAKVIAPKIGKLKTADTFYLEDGKLKISWYLWEGARPVCHGYALESGFIAVMYKGELYNFNSHISNFRNFGIIDKEIQNRLTIIIEPQIHTQETDWGVFPDQSRSNLFFTGNGKKSIELPMEYWGLLFIKNMPEEIVNTIKELHKDRDSDDLIAGNEALLKRILDKYGNRFADSIHVIDYSNKSKIKKDPTDEEVPVNQKSTGLIDSSQEGESFLNGVSKGSSEGKGSDTGEKKTGVAIDGSQQIWRRIRVKKAKSTGDSTPSIEIKIKKDMPIIVPVGKNDMQHEVNICFYKDEHRFEDGHMGSAVFFNEESPIIQETAEFHQKQHNVMYSNAIKKDVLSAYRQVALCKVSHVMKLFKVLNKDQVIKEYLSEQALTSALMGFISEDSLISPRLGKYGSKNKSTVPENDFTAVEP
jgi:hypothetical protein